MKRTLALAAVVLLLALAGWWWSTVPPVPRHVIFISLDTLRADHLGAYGHPTAQTPRLDGFADEAVLFEQHISAAPTTLASHTAFFTGNHPHTHGVPRNDYLVHADNLMLPEILEEAGWQTAAILGAIPLGTHSNFTQGFETVDEDFSLSRAVKEVAQTMRTATEVTDTVLGWLAARTDPRRLFLFVHYFDVHSPYDPPDRFRKLYPHGKGMADVGSMRGIMRTRYMLFRGMQEAPQRSEALKQLYLGGVSYVDDEVGRLLDGLADQGLLDDALVIITSDHGEAFDSHEEFFDHGETVYDETVHTPMMWRFPQGWRGGSRLSDQVSSVDLFPSLLELLQLPAHEVDGRSYLAEVRGLPFTEPRPPAFSEATKPHTVQGDAWQNDPMHKSIRTPTHKLILQPRKDVRALYDLTVDPDELARLQDPWPTEALSLSEQLDAWRAAADPLPTRRMSNRRMRAELSALGYVEANEEDDGGEAGETDDPGVEPPE